MSQVFDLTLGKVAMLLIFIFIGYFLRHHKLLPENSAKVLSLLVTTIFVPCYSIHNLASTVRTEVFGDKLLILGYGFLFIIVALGLSALLSKLLAKNRIQRASLLYAFSVPNYGYFGYPVIEGVFGTTMLADTMIFALPMALFTYSIGYQLFSGGKKLSLKKMLTSPLLLSMFIGIALGLTELPIPKFIDDILVGAGNCMSPCSMLLAGFLLGKFHFVELLNSWRSYLYSAIRMVLIPAVFGGLLCLCGVRDIYLMLPLMIAGMPLGLNLVVFPESLGHEKEASDNAKLCFISILMALTTLPFLFSLIVRIA